MGGAKEGPFAVKSAGITPVPGVPGWVQISIPGPQSMPVNAFATMDDPPALIDSGTLAGSGAATLVLALHDLGLRPADIEVVAYTHPHVDHMGGGSALTEVLSRARHHLPVGFDQGFISFMRRSREAVRRSYEVAGLSLGEGLDNEIAAYCEEHLPVGPEIEGTVSRPGDRIRAGRSTLTVVPTPGHTPWCTTFVDEDAGVAFTGDLVVGSGTSFNALLGSSIEEYLESLSRLRSLDLGLLLPGHGVPRDGASEALEGCRRTMELQAEKILDTLAIGPSGALDILRRVWPRHSLAPRRFPIELGRVVAILDWLAGRGSCLRDERTGLWETAAVQQDEASIR